MNYCPSCKQKTPNGETTRIARTPNNRWNAIVPCAVCGKSKAILIRQIDISKWTKR